MESESESGRIGEHIEDQRLGSRELSGGNYIQWDEEEEQILTGQAEEFSFGIDNDQGVLTGQAKEF